jgi:hypothetical protein
VSVNNTIAAAVTQERTGGRGAGRSGVEVVEVIEVEEVAGVTMINPIV